MRAIKFRGKVGDVNEWVYGYLVGEDKIYQPKERKDCKRCGVGVFRVEPNTIGQFTGLYDKYGEKIYEGDILQGGYESVSFDPEVVFWNNFECMFAIKGRYENLPFGETAIERFSYAVVGNVFDNPELLEE